MWGVPAQGMLIWQTGRIGILVDISKHAGFFLVGNCLYFSILICFHIDNYPKLVYLRIKKKLY